jgi:hypothetical protein
MSHVSLDISHVVTRQTILPVLVLYNCSLESSSTYRTFVASSHNALRDPPLIAVYDNSQLRQVIPAEEVQLFAYKHDPHNSGIATAYNWAHDIAISHGISWLLLLDQDSELPLEFLESTLIQLNQYESNPDVVALVPVVQSCATVISPMRIGFGGLRSLHTDSFGNQKAKIMAINSGSAIRCDFICLIHGFNHNFWLDFLDYWLFYQIYANHKMAAVSKCVIEHKLSVHDCRHSVSTTRYRSILAGEAGFMTTYRSKAEIPFYLLRLLSRAIKFVLQQRVDLAQLTFYMLFRIIIHPTRSLEGSHEWF